MKNIFSILFVLLQLTALAQHNTDPKSAAASGFNPERLQRIDKLLTQYIDSGWMKGAAALVTQNGKVVYNKAFGQDKVNPATPLKTDAIFRIASQTKAITSTAVLMLFEEGKFLLDDPISKYIPSFAKPQVLATFEQKDSSYTTVPAKREITIRDLLTHTSGIDYAQIGTPTMQAIYAKAGIVAGFSREKANLGEMIDKLAKLPLAHQPGEKFTYSLGVDVLGRLVEVTSGLNLDQFLRKRIFEPLGMQDTYFELPVEKQSRLVQVYTEDKKTGKIIPWSDDTFPNSSVDYPINHNGLYAGGAGLVSTLADYAIFLQMILNGGIYNNQQILSRHTVDIMTKNQIGQLSLGPDKFGLGFAVITEEGHAKLGVSPGSIAWGGFFSTIYWADPKENLIGLLFAQQNPFSHEEVGDKFRVLVYLALR